jgi:hypothetical protein
MDIYPQSQNGSVCQFPFEKRLSYRTILNTFEDGSRIALEDPNASAIRWILNYSGLTDSEKGSFQAFFESMSGRLNNFTFLDPSGNLFAWSEDLTKTLWQKSPLLQSVAGSADPVGTQRATTVSNTGPGDLTLVQSVSVPGSHLCCLSFYVQAANATTITLTRDSAAETFAVSSTWRRVSLTATSSGADSSAFGLTIPSGAQATVFGMQVEPQMRPSSYVQTLDRSGVYPTTRFDSDSLSFRADAPNSHSCEIKLFTKLAL